MKLSEFDQYAKEKVVEALREIRHEIDSHGIIMQISNGKKIIGENVYIAKEIVLEIIDKHIAEGNYAQ